MARKPRAVSASVQAAPEDRLPIGAVYVCESSPSIVNPLGTWHKGEPRYVSDGGFSAQALLELGPGFRMIYPEKPAPEAQPCDTRDGDSCMEGDAPTAELQQAQ